MYLNTTEIDQFIENHIQFLFLRKQILVFIQNLMVLIQSSVGLYKEFSGLNIDLSWF